MAGRVEGKSAEDVRLMSAPFAWGRVQSLRAWACVFFFCFSCALAKRVPMRKTVYDAKIPWQRAPTETHLAAALDLALLELDGMGVEPDRDVGAVVALGREGHLVGHDALARVEAVARQSRVGPGCGARLVLLEGDLLDDVLGRDVARVGEADVRQEEVADLEDHAELGMERVGRREHVVTVELGGRRLLDDQARVAAHVADDAKALEVRHLLRGQRVGQAGAGAVVDEGGRAKVAH